MSRSSYWSFCRLFGDDAICARDLIIDSAPILAWRRCDPDAASVYAPAHHPRPLLRGFRVHTLICRGSGLPLFFLLSQARLTRCSFCSTFVRRGSAPLSNSSPCHSLGCCLLGFASYCLDSCYSWCYRCHSVESKKPEEPFLLASNLDQGRTGKA